MDEIGLFFWEPLECPAWPMEDEAMEGVGRWLNMESLAIEEFWPYWERGTEAGAFRETPLQRERVARASWGVDWGEAALWALVMLMALAIGRLVGGG